MATWLLHFTSCCGASAIWFDTDFFTQTSRVEEKRMHSVQEGTCWMPLPDGMIHRQMSHTKLACRCQVAFGSHSRKGAESWKHTTPALSVHLPQSGHTWCVWSVWRCPFPLCYPGLLLFHLGGETDTSGLSGRAEWVRTTSFGHCCTHTHTHTHTFSHVYRWHSILDLLYAVYQTNFYSTRPLGCCDTCPNLFSPAQREKSFLGMNIN